VPIQPGLGQLIQFQAAPASNRGRLSLYAGNVESCNGHAASSNNENCASNTSGLA